MLSINHSRVHQLKLLCHAHLCVLRILIRAIAATLKSSFKDEMASMVKSVMSESVGAIVDGVLQGLHARIASLETINKELLEENNALKMTMRY